MTAVFLLLFSASSFAQQTFVGSGGSGTQNNPYLISSPADLVELSDYANAGGVLIGPPISSNTYGKYFQMTNSINMGNIVNFEPIEIFCGNFDGGGFAIQNLNITPMSPYPREYALFLQTWRATISNLTLDNFSIVDTFANGHSIASFLLYAYDSLTMVNCVAKNCTLHVVSGSACGIFNSATMPTGPGWEPGVIHIDNCHVINTVVEGIAVVGFCSAIGTWSCSCEECPAGFIPKNTITNSSVTNSSLTAHPRTIISTAQYSRVVAFISLSYCTSFSGCCVSNCIISAGDALSGFTGGSSMHNSTLNNCYARAQLYITVNNPWYSGGFDGASGFVATSYDHTYSNCYAACDFTTANNNYTYTASFGCNTGNLSKFTNCYYLNQPPISGFTMSSFISTISNLTGTPLPDPFGVVGKTQPELQDTSMAAYPGAIGSSLNYQQPSMPWRADDSINPINKGYPILWWQQLSTVTTLAATDITNSSATLNGMVSKNGDSIVERGFQYRQAGDSVWTTITLSDTTTNISDSLTGLTIGTSYEFKAYVVAYNLYNIATYGTRTVTKYGDTLTFTTGESAVVITLEASDITYKSATLNGMVIENDEPVVERGFQWRKTEDSVWITLTVSDITDTIFSSLTALTPNTSYEFKAYITTHDTTKYGDTLTFTTLEEVPSEVITLDAADITETTVVLHGEVIENDEPVLERGFEWRQLDADNWKTVLAMGAGNISYSLTNLTPNTEYEFVAYIRTPIVKYGEILAFTTLDDVNIREHSSRSGVTLFPNPTTGKLTIRNEKSGMSSEIEVFDVVGRKLLSHTPLTSHSSPLIEIDISHLAAGMYFLKIDGKFLKVVKQ